MDRLLGHLAKFAAFSKQAELLCTQALAYLLRDPEAERAFAELVGSATGCAPEPRLRWHAESRHTDGGRPDLEGRGRGDAPRVKVEGKLGAPFGDGQLESYVAALTGVELQGGGEVPASLELPGALVLLVPGVRREEAAQYVRSRFAAEGPGPWRVTREACEVPVGVLTWEGVLDALAEASSDGFRDDVAQLRAMYRVLNGDDMEPITSDEEVLAWRGNEGWWVRLVDLATRRLTAAGQDPLPKGLEKGAQPYHRRYVCREVPGGHSCYSVGVRDPFEGHRTPVWLRFNRSTGHFDEAVSNLEEAGIRPEGVLSRGDLWFPLEVPLDASQWAMVSALVAQARRIVDVAWSPTRSATRGRVD